MLLGSMSLFLMRHLVLYHNTIIRLTIRLRQHQNIRCECIHISGLPHSCINIIHDFSQPSVLSAFCICLIPVFVEIFIIFIASHQNILMELWSLFVSLLDMTLEKRFYKYTIPNHTMICLSCPMDITKDVSIVIQRMCLGVVFRFLSIFTKCFLTFIVTNGAHLITTLSLCSWGILLFKISKVNQPGDYNYNVP